MNRILAFLFFLLFLAGIAFMTLKTMQPIEANGAELAFLGVDWRPVTVDGEAVPGNSTLLLRFERDGRLNGHGGCNGFFGTYKLGASGIEIGPLGATKMSCPEPLMSLERRFFDVLERTRRLLVEGDRLVLRDAEDGELAVFVVSKASV
ncbi:MAG: META domain-containing protein [Woeseiaceae bacterium]